MKKQITEIRGQDTAELKAKLADLRKEQFGLRFHGSAEEVAKTTRHSEVRRTIARILLVLGERERSGGQPAPAAASPQATGKQATGKQATGKQAAGKTRATKN